MSPRRSLPGDFRRGRACLQVPTRCQSCVLSSHRSELRAMRQTQQRPALCMIFGRQGCRRFGHVDSSTWMVSRQGKPACQGGGKMLGSRGFCGHLAGTGADANQPRGAGTSPSTVSFAQPLANLRLAGRWFPKQAATVSATVHRVIDTCREAGCRASCRHIIVGAGGGSCTLSCGEQPHLAVSSTKVSLEKQPAPAWPNSAGAGSTSPPVTTYVHSDKLVGLGPAMPFERGLAKWHCIIRTHCCTMSGLNGPCRNPATTRSRALACRRRTTCQSAERTDACVARVAQCALAAHHRLANGGRAEH